MTNRSSFNSTKFDEYHVTYDIALAKGLSISGEDQDYFARHRIAWVADRLQQLHQQPRPSGLGCGTGSAMPLLFDLIRTQSVVAIDTSTKCLNVAKRTRDCEQAQFLAYSQYKPSEQTWRTPMKRFITSRKRASLRQSITSTVHCGPGGSSRFGRTIRGTSAPDT